MMEQSQSGLQAIEEYRNRREERERAFLWLRFRCGHLARLRNPENVHEWLDQARYKDCPKCTPPIDTGTLRDSIPNVTMLGDRTKMILIPQLTENP